MVPRMSDGDPKPWNDPAGPYQAHQIRDGEHVELSDGHAIHCMTAGRRHAQSNLVGGSVLDTDPAVTSSGTASGIAFNDDKNLRAPDIVVNADMNGDGWVREAPPLAVEYAGVGQDKEQLARKIKELHEFGTRYIWVIHLVGPLRVEVHERGLPMRTVPGDGVLTAPGVLQNPVPVRALVDRDAAHEATLRNLLARHGYPSIDAIREEGRDEGLKAGLEAGHKRGLDQQLARAREALQRQLQSRGWTLAPGLQARIAACTDIAVLIEWASASTTAASAEAALR